MGLPITHFDFRLLGSLCRNITCNGVSVQQEKLCYLRGCFHSSVRGGVDGLDKEVFCGPKITSASLNPSCRTQNYDSFELRSS